MEPFELLKIVAELCERMGIRNLTVGSLATTAFGQPRFTNDIDLVLDLHEEQIDEFCRAFAAPEYCLSQAAVQTAVAQKSIALSPTIPPGLLRGFRERSASVFGPTSRPYLHRPKT